MVCSHLHSVQVKILSGNNLKSIKEIWRINQPKMVNYEGGSVSAGKQWRDCDVSQ